MKYLWLLLTLLPLVAVSQSDTANTPTQAIQHEVVEADFYYYIIGNWRNGPEVLIGPPMQGSEQKSMEQMKAEAIKQLPNFEGVRDIDVVIESSLQAAEQSRQILASKYKRRELTVKVF